MMPGLAVRWGVALQAQFDETHLGRAVQRMQGEAKRRLPDADTIRIHETIRCCARAPSSCMPADVERWEHRISCDSCHRDANDGVRIRGAIEHCRRDAERSGD